jgi:peptide/nickel transport system permease protein
VNIAIGLRMPGFLHLAACRLARFLVVLLAGGLLGAVLVRVAPGFGTDERMLDTRLSNASIQAIARERSDGGDIAGYYKNYLHKLLHGDLGTSTSLGRPVRELLRERASLTLRITGCGLAFAWAAALALILLLEWIRVPGVIAIFCDGAVSTWAGALLCVPAALFALGCFYFGGSPSLAVAAILFPRVFLYGQKAVRHAHAAPHVLAAHALGESRWRVLMLHVLTPVWPELVALAGISVSMAAGAAIPVETLTDSAGVGQLVWQAALARDLPVIVNVTLLITALTAAANLAADLSRAAWEAA